ncbi:pepsin/retropepsin-like aspartic protease family protein [Aureibaculum sp. 2210JD6-5]|uniref:pepsin/retropepsin-like aspartic protease family protein n=1 Tax=Aureibaculum sp. 2210JD6-5 TaxID=3103957 RepID=UPI002AAE2527|nr:pepsin/retropepsin-like aspartic protease family protein [Aureibaculum sp. 2210JD6-5]MDY7395334.1 pepsin/retropepsin-like aspartic protease family protein [Aureibaculum sp. 2210JD6-5]
MTILRLYIIGIFLCCSTFLFADDNELDVNTLQFPKAEYIGENTVRIPFKLYDNLIVIEAEIFNQKGNFVIDTGAEKLLLNNVHFKNTNNKPSHLRHSGISSDIDEVKIKWLKKMLVRDFSIDNVKSHILDLSHIEKSKKMSLFGVVGYNVLKNYEIFIDFYLKQITLSKIDNDGNKIDDLPYLEKITDTINFTLRKHTIVLDSYVNNQKLKFGLDTGAEMNLLDRSVSKKVMKNFINPKKMVVVGAGKEKNNVLAGKLHKVKLSNAVYCGPMKTILTNMKTMDIAYGTKLDGVLGYEFIATRRMILNYKKKQLYFIKTVFFK